MVPQLNIRNRLPIIARHWAGLRLERNTVVDTPLSGKGGIVYDNK